MAHVGQEFRLDAIGGLRGFLRHPAFHQRLFQPHPLDRAVAEHLQSALAGVPVTLPALTRALKLQTKAGKVGFDWNDPRAVLRKIREEADEIEAALDADDQSAAAEVGDLLFAAVNLARHLDADPEATLRQTNDKFERRFASIERALAARGKAPKDSTLAEMDALWNEAKAQEETHPAHDPSS